MKPMAFCLILLSPYIRVRDHRPTAFSALAVEGGRDPGAGCRQLVVHPHQDRDLPCTGGALADGQVITTHIDIGTRRHSQRQHQQLGKPARHCGATAEWRGALHRRI